MRKILIAGLVGLAVVMGLQAQSALTGTWQGASPGGSTVVLEAKASGTVLSGTLTVMGWAEAGACRWHDRQEHAQLHGDDAWR